MERRKRNQRSWPAAVQACHVCELISGVKEGSQASLIRITTTYVCLDHTWADAISTKLDSCTQAREVASIVAPIRIRAVYDRPACEVAEYILRAVKHAVVA